MIEMVVGSAIMLVGVIVGYAIGIDKVSKTGGEK